MKSTLLVKIFLAVNLLFSFAVAGFGYKIFQDRELMKARNVLVAENLSNIASRLGYGEQQPWESSAQGEGAFAITTPQSSSELPALVASLDSLESVAGTRVEQLAETYATVQTVKASLETERATLSEKESELATTRTRVANMEIELTSTRETLETMRSDDAKIDREIERLEGQLENLQQQTTGLQEQISLINERLRLRTGERDRIEELLAACRQPRNQDGGDDNWHQKTAKILAVDPEWNYVVINKGEVDVLPMYLEAFVHRGDEFIGKIRVMQVEDTVSLAEILPNTMSPGMQVQSGDTLFF